jgi:hypothetical protein
VCYLVILQVTKRDDNDEEEAEDKDGDKMGKAGEMETKTEYVISGSIPVSPEFSDLRVFGAPPRSSLYPSLSPHTVPPLYSSPTPLMSRQYL